MKILDETYSIQKNRIFWVSESNDAIFICWEEVRLEIRLGFIQSWQVTIEFFFNNSFIFNLNSYTNRWSLEETACEMKRVEEMTNSNNRYFDAKFDYFNLQILYQAQPNF